MSRFAFAVVFLFALACSSRRVDLSAPPGAGGGTGAAPDPVPESPAASGDRPLCPPGFVKSLKPGHHTSFFSAGQGRSFDLRVPSAKFTGPRPLFFAFHGTGLSGAQGIHDYNLDLWVAAGAIVVGPDSNGNGTLWPVWDAFVVPGEKSRKNPDLQFFDDLLQCVTVHYSVDPKRVYVGGHSAGGSMANFILGQRSDVLAGGIAASGVFDLTQPNPQIPIQPLTAIVTWGGMNDVYSGSAGSVSIANYGFAEQSTLASQYWKQQSAVRQIACRGNEVGHVWLAPVSAWMRDVLLSRPKGTVDPPGYHLPPLPSGAAVTCSEDAAVYTSPVKVACPAASTPACQAFCQLQGRCLVENGTIGPTILPQLGQLGWTRTENICGGCVTRCEADAKGSEADQAVLECLAASGPKAMCRPGIKGEEIFDTVGACCDKSSNKSSSKLCGRFCTVFKASGLASALKGCP